MAIKGTFDYDRILPRGGERDRGTGYINVSMESLEIDGIGKVVKSESLNVAMHGWELAGRGCSVNKWHRRFPSTTQSVTMKNMSTT